MKQFKIQDNNKSIHCYNRVGLLQVVASLVPEPYDLKKSCFAPDFHWFAGEDKIYHPNLQWFLMEINKKYGTCFDARRSHSNGAGYMIHFDKVVKLREIDFNSMLKPKREVESTTTIERKMTDESLANFLKEGKKEKQQEIIIKDYKEEQEVTVKSNNQTQEQHNEQEAAEESVQDRTVQGTEGEVKEDQTPTQSISGSGNNESDSSEQSVVKEDNRIYPGGGLVGDVFNYSQTPDFDSMIPPQWSKKKVSALAKEHNIELDSSKKMKEMVEEFKEKYGN